MTALIPSPAPLGHILAAAEGVLLEQVADWLPRPSPPRDLSLTDQDPLPLDDDGAPDRDDPPTIDLRHPEQPAARASAAAVAGAILECLAGHRPASHLRMLCTDQALSRVRRWPRRTGWRRARVTAVPVVRLARDQVDAVVMIALADRHLAMSVRLRRYDERWLVDDAQLLLTEGVSEALQAP